MQIEPLAIRDLKLVKPTIVRDSRGVFSETYNKRDFAKGGIDVTFVQDNHSLSVANGVVRGLHFQIPPCAQDKLVRVVRGSIFDVAVDIRYGAPTYGQHVAVVLSAKNRRQLWVPKGFAHGFCTLEPHAEVLYKVTDYYAPEHDRGLAWDDPDLGIDWPVTAETAILSEKDRHHPTLAELPAHFASCVS
jgi:dTDP-4-dehydrorhamnose 3,5-epimerase